MNTPDWIKQIKTPGIKKIRIPVYAPILTGNEKKYVNDCLSSNWLTSKGSYVRKFEEKFADFCHSPYAISVSSGTSGLFLSLLALGIKKGDEVIVPSFTMISTAFAVSYLGAKPVFADCDIKSGNITSQTIEKSITGKTKAVIPVHVYGNPCDMESIRKITDKYKIAVVEDAAEAFGSIYKNRIIGSISPINVFSLYINKVVTAGEGGMITLKSSSVYTKIKRINNYAYSNIRHFWHREIGYNFRLSNLHSAIGLGQIEHAKDTLARKNIIAEYYRKLLKPVENLFKAPEITGDSISNFWKIAYRIMDNRYSVMDLRNKLASFGIETRGFFLPLHLQPIYRKKEYTGKFPNAEEFSRSGLLLPSGPGLEKRQIAEICSIILDYFRH